MSEFKCNEQFCFRSFSNLRSYKNHMNQHENNFLSQTFDIDQSLDTILNVPTSVHTETQYDHIPNSFNNTTSVPAIGIEKFKHILKTNTLLLAAKWYSNKVIPRKEVQVLFDDVQYFNNSFLHVLKNKVMDSLKTNSNSDNINEISAMFDVLLSPFTDIKTEHLRFKAFEEVGVLVKPEMVDIGQRLNDRLELGRVIFEPKSIEMSDIPLKHVLKLILESSNLFISIMNYMKDLENQSDNCISSFTQSPIWLSKLKKNANKIVFPIFLFFDDFEITNPLGSHSGSQKLGALYISLPCLPPELSSSIENIFLAGLFKSNDRTEFGNHAVFKHIINQLNFLENIGIEINIKGCLYHVFFSLGLILGDNLGLHSVLGFTESFVADYPCRFCKLSKTECHNQIDQLDDKLRNIDTYNSDIEINNVSLTGIKQTCVFNEISSFHVTENYAVDIMHDLLEGVCKYDIGLMLNRMIFSLKYFTLNTLNDRIESFNYGSIDIRNRPPLISVDTLKPTGTLKMSACEMSCFMRNLGLMIGDLVPEDSTFWQVYTILRQILDIVFSKTIKFKDINLLKVLISEHHELYMQVFNTHLKPKHHHMIHYPMIIQKSGPLSMMWSMRFEAKHKQFKDAANSTSSRKNVLYTLALKHQLHLSYRFLLNKNINISGLEIGRILNLSFSKRENYNTNNMYFSTIKLNFLNDNLIFVSWIKLKNQTYNSNNMTIVLSMNDGDNNLPKFGLIQSLVILNDSIPFVICKLFTTNYFDDHYQAFNVTLSNQLLCHSLENLASINPTVCCKSPNGSCHISVKY